MQIQTLTSCLWIVFGVSWKSCWNWQNQNKRFYYCQLTVSPEKILWPHADMIHPINLQFLAKAPNAAIHAGRRDWAWEVLGTPEPGASAVLCCPAVRERMAGTSSQSYSSGKEWKERFRALKAHQELVPGLALHLSLKVQSKGHSHHNHTEQISLDRLNH